MEEALRRAIQQAGGQSALADKFTRRGKRLTKSAISQWKKCPPRRVIDLEAISGVPRQELRPDLYPEQNG